MRNRPYCTSVTCCLLVGFAVTSAGARVIPRTIAESVGLAADRLERITEVMEQHVAKGHIPGATALIARHGKVAYFKTFGYQDREAGTPMEEDAIFRMYFLSKAITGVAVMVLHEEGRFFLNDPIAKYLPELSDLKVAVEVHDPKSGRTVIQTVPANSEITIRDLLRHTSGITIGSGKANTGTFYRAAGIRNAGQDLATFVEKLGEVPLEFHPGSPGGTATRLTYSDASLRWSPASP